ncbi:unnamed protein product [Caenorhabditis brenneri]
MENRKRRGFYDDDRNLETDAQDSSPPRKRAVEGDGVSTEEMFIPADVVGLVIGRSGSEILMMSAVYKCRVFVVTTDIPSSGLRTVQLTGTPNAIDQAKKHICELIAKSRSAPEEPQTIQIMIPANKCGMVIGKAGETMRKLRNLSGCQIHLVQDNKLADSDKPLQVTGLPAQVKRAEQLVEDILKTTPETYISGHIAGRSENTKTIHVNVPREAVGAIMGTNGVIIKKLSQETGTKIQFMPDADPTLLERSIAIIGTPIKIEIAVGCIRQIVSMATSSQHETKNGPLTIFYLTVPSNKCGLVIGRGGEVIKQINVESGAHCELSREKEETLEEKTFVIRGTDQQVEHAKHLIGQKVGDIPPMTPFVRTDIRHGVGARAPIGSGSWEVPSFPPVHTLPPQPPTTQYVPTFYPPPQPPQPQQPSLQYREQYQAPPIYSGIAEPPNPLEMFQKLKRIGTTSPMSSVPQNPYCPTYSSDDYYRGNQEPARGERRRESTDYTDQWMEFYRQTGDTEEMSLVRQHIDKNRRSY